MSILVYDCEIAKAIPPRNPADRDDSVAYCDGWRDFEGMGIACIGAYDYASYRYRVFCQDNLGEFQAAVDKADYVVGFNNHQFDDKLVAAEGIGIPPEKSYDILAEVWQAHGLGRTYQGKSHQGFGLDACARANGFAGKNGHGADAPVLWQRGQIGQVIDYCLNDVYLTRHLLQQIFHGGLLSPKDGRRLSIPSPTERLARFRGMAVPEPEHALYGEDCA